MDYFGSNSFQQYDSELEKGYETGDFSKILAEIPREERMVGYEFHFNSTN